MPTKRVLRWVLRLFARFDLRPEMEDPQRVLASIAQDATFRGINLWVLVTATIVASVGLNVNSTAVIIGAMLISPLMGPINGIGVSLAIYDVQLFYRSVRNLAVAVLFSLLASALYFLITPLKEAGSELLARTTPTFWDVLIAFFGGLSGAIAALGRGKKTNVIAGVAIATALMPPLCTAGYGIGTLQPRFLFGALYLFLINAVFISASSYLAFQVIRFPNREFVDKAYQNRIRRVMAFVVLATLIPSVYVAYTVVKEAVEEARVRAFLEEAFAAFPTTSVVERQKILRKDTVRLKVVLVGQPLTPEQVAYLNHELQTTYKLPTYQLEVVQGTSDRPQAMPEVARLLEATERSYTQLQRLSDSLRLVERQLLACREEQQRRRAEQTQLLQEMQALFPPLSPLAVESLPVKNGQQVDTVLIVVLGAMRPWPAAEEARLQKWLKVRTGRSRLLLVPWRG
ncbi:MAG: TIGR00341 family protein [Bacteroidetes bacterium]|nr:MAG: TIGR00341 family protein [Bacteroidota bacterium]